MPEEKDVVEKIEEIINNEVNGNHGQSERLAIGTFSENNINDIRTCPDPKARVVALSLSMAAFATALGQELLSVDDGLTKRDCLTICEALGMLEHHLRHGSVGTKSVYAWEYKEKAPTPEYVEDLICRVDRLIPKPKKDKT